MYREKKYHRLFQWDSEHRKVRHCESTMSVMNLSRENQCEFTLYIKTEHMEVSYQVSPVCDVGDDHTEVRRDESTVFVDCTHVVPRSFLSVFV